MPEVTDCLSAVQPTVRHMQIFIQALVSANGAPVLLLHSRNRVSQQHFWPSSMATTQRIRTAEDTMAEKSLTCMDAGCTLASAIAAELAKGREPLTAVQRAKAWLGEALQASAALHIGRGPHRPLNHG